MPALLKPLQLAIITASIFNLSACDKKNTAAISQPVASTTTPSAAPASSNTKINAVSTVNASNYAKVLSVAMLGQFLVGYANEAHLNDAQRHCLLELDLEKAATEFDKIFAKVQSPTDKKAFDDLYGGELGQRTIDFTKQSIDYSMGMMSATEPVMNSADKAKIDPFNQSAPAQHLRESLDEKEMLRVTLPIVNAQLKQCQLAEVPMQAVMSNLVASAPASAQK